MFSQCPDRGQLQTYVDNEMALLEQKQMEKHLHACPQCNALVINLIEENHWLTDLFASENLLLSKEHEFQPQAMINAQVNAGWASFWLILFGVAAAMLISRFLLFPWLNIDSLSWLVLLAFKQGWNLTVATGVSLMANIDFIKQIILALAWGGVMLSLIPLYVLRRNISWEDNVIG